MKILGALIAWLALISSVPSDDLRPIRITGRTYDGVTFSLKSADWWTPSEADVRIAESLLPAYLRTPRAAQALRGTRISTELGNYKRQYWGVVRKGRREISIHFYHRDTEVVRSGRWLRAMVTVAGGGDRYFQVMYYVQRKAFHDLGVNAPE